MKKKLKMFVWKNVFCDYTCGIAFGIGETKEQAMDCIAKIDSYEKNQLLEVEPEVYSLDKPVGFMVYGGG